MRVGKARVLACPVCVSPVQVRGAVCAGAGRAGARQYRLPPEMRYTATPRACSA